MPIFEFMCVNCGKSFEHLVSSTVNKKFSTFGVKGGSAGSSFSSGDNCAPSGGG